MKEKILSVFKTLAVLALILSLGSCERDFSDRFAYVAGDDVLPPEIEISVPAFNQTYLYGNHVAIVGTVTDLESAKNDIHDPGFRKGELSKVTINVDDLTNNTKLLSREPDVLGTDGYSINERVEIVTGSGVTQCRLIVVATDGNNQTVRDTVNFEYQ